MCDKTDDPIRLVLINGVSADDLRVQLKADFERWGWYRGAPILPFGTEFCVIELQPDRFEPDIELQPDRSEPDVEDTP